MASNFVLDIPHTNPSTGEVCMRKAIIFTPFNNEDCLTNLTNRVRFEEWRTTGSQRYDAKRDPEDFLHHNWEILSAPLEEIVKLVELYDKHLATPKDAMKLAGRFHKLLKKATTDDAPSDDATSRCDTCFPVYYACVKKLQRRLKKDKAILTLPGFDQCFARLADTLKFEEPILSPGYYAMWADEMTVEK